MRVKKDASFVLCLLGMETDGLLDHANRWASRPPGEGGDQFHCAEGPKRLLSEFFLWARNGSIDYSFWGHSQLQPCSSSARHLQCWPLSCQDSSALQALETPLLRTLLRTFLRTLPSTCDGLREPQGPTSPKKREKGIGRSEKLAVFKLLILR